MAKQDPTDNLLDELLAGDPGPQSGIGGIGDQYLLRHLHVCRPETSFSRQVVFAYLASLGRDCSIKPYGFQASREYSEQRRLTSAGY